MGGTISQVGAIYSGFMRLYDERDEPGLADSGQKSPKGDSSVFFCVLLNFKDLLGSSPGFEDTHARHHGLTLDEFDSSRVGRRDCAAPRVRRKPSVRSARPAFEGVSMISFDHRDLV